MSASPTSRVQIYHGPDHSPLLVGNAFMSTRRNTLTTTFNYDSSYLENPQSWPVSPDLPLASGSSVSGLPGAMADGAPDRWGERLIERRINAQAREAGRALPMVTAVDYLLGVSDLMRHGALRYRLTDTSDFLSVGTEVPKLINLPELLHATEAVARSRDDDEMAAIKLLLGAGSSALGGARPKSSVQVEGRLFIAKFPHHADDWDVMAWEMTTLDLAKRAGLVVAHSRLENLGGKNVLLLERFDRSGADRIPYISAMTMLGGKDGLRFEYIELAEAIATHGGSVRVDLEQLWRRIAFSIAIHNTDDHMRNHGFLRENSGWTLSPAFDINPNPIAAAERASSIGYKVSPKDDFQGLMDSAQYFHLDEGRTKEIWSEVLEAVSGWRRVATSFGVSKLEQTFFAPVLDRYLTARSFQIQSICTD